MSGASTTPFAAARAAAAPDPGTARDLLTARRLVAGTMAYNVLEAAVAVAAGVAAGSIALVGFGLDSVIECAAAGAMLWRLSVQARGADAEVVERTEARVRRFIGGTFVALALYVVLEAGAGLLAGERPEGSPVGIALAVLSLAVMPGIAWWKLRVAARLRSGSLRAEAKETLACAWLSFALLLGLAANALAGWWWADGVAALAMVPWLVREGLEGLRGESCCDDDGCGDGCAEGSGPGGREGSGEGCGDGCCGGGGTGAGGDGRPDGAPGGPDARDGAR